MGNIMPWGMYSARAKAIERVQQKRSARFEEFRSRVSTEDGEVIGKRNRILHMEFCTLRDALQKEELTAVEVLETYYWKAIQVQERLNCINEVIVESWEWAREADEKWRGKSPKPPLYGVPFSVKGNFHVVGYDCNLGLGKYTENPMTDECTFVTHLRYLGAIPFVITTVPQALLSFVCSSSVYGTTCNPHDVTRSPGGSSGGEAVLHSSGGSPFGTGSDLLGSLRIPASFCGLTVMKPSESRFVVRGAHGGVPGRGRLGLGYGFFTHSVNEQMELLKEVLGHDHYAKLVPDSGRMKLDLDKCKSNSKLRIGYYEYDDFLRSVPSVRRAVREVVEKLRAEGHELIPFTVPRAQDAAQLMFKNALPDGGSYSRFLYSNDVVDKHMKQFVRLLGIPACIRSFFSHFIRILSPQLALIAQSSMKSLEDCRYTQELTDNYKEEFISYWKNVGIDALICPAFAVTAISHELPQHLAPCAFACGLYNLIDFPAGTLPVRRVTKEDDDELMDENEFRVGRNMILKMMRDGCKNSIGMPVTVQVVTLPNEEELCLSLMRRIEKMVAYDYKVPGQHTPAV